MKKLVLSALLILSGLLFGGLYYSLHYLYVPSELKVVHLPISDLPDGWEGLKIGHLTDIHVGNFRGEEELKEAIELLMAQKPDLIFITGDLVEKNIEEMERYEALFRKLKAPQGVFVIVGNHEYGPNHGQVERDGERIQKVKRYEESLGWNCLLNEHKIITIGGSKMAIVGTENYRIKKSFPTYADLPGALRGTEDVFLRLLLTHDPAHWRAEVLEQEKTPIAITFSGHTHGDWLKLRRWAVDYYPEYRGLYEHEGRYLYVSTGIGNSKKFGRRFIRREVALIVLTRKK